MPIVKILLLLLFSTQAFARPVIIWNKSCASGAFNLGTGTCLATSGGTVTGVTASSPLASSGGTTHDISCAVASTTQAGCISSVSFTLFNNKLTSPMTADGDIIVQSGGVPSRLAHGTPNTILTWTGTDLLYQKVTDSQIDSAAAISFSKMAALTANRALISNASGIVTVSPDISDAELDALDGISSNIQTQLNGKQAGPLVGDVATSGATATIQPHVVSNSKFRQSAALSLVGVSGNATADVADIAAGTDNQVMRRSGTAIGFGTVNLASSNAVTGVLPNANTTGTSANTASTIVARSSGKAFQITSISGDDGIAGIDFNASVWNQQFEGSPVVSIDVANSCLHNYADSDECVVNWASEILHYGDVDRLNWQLGRLYDDSGNIMVDWLTGKLGDNGGVTRIDFGNGSGPTTFNSRNGEERMRIEDNTGVYVDHLNGKMVEGCTSPSVSPGTGSGTGGSASLVGTDTAFEVTVTTGTLPSTGAQIFDVSFCDTYNNGPIATFSPSNATAATLSGLSMVFVTSNTGHLFFTSGTTALTASATYKWMVHVIGWTNAF